MIYVQVSDQLDQPLPISIEAVQQAAQTALAYLSVAEKSELTIILTNDEQLHQLNLQFMGVDAPTDVLSFPAGITDPDTGGYYLGDILISVPQALTQAQANLQSGAEEIKLLVVHGVLHLLGYDHAEPKEQDQLWEIQSVILTSITSQADQP
jgi:probable rRNA maturation factor